MARQGVTYSEVASAADTLVSNGQQPTIKAIRDHLGTGSPNTIHMHLTTWRDEQPVHAVSSEIPEALTAAIAKEIAKAASTAKAGIEALLLESRAEAEELAKAGAEIESEMAVMAEQVSALTTARDTLMGKTEQQRTEIEHLRADVENAQKARALAEQEVAVMASRLELLATVKTERDEAYKQMSEYREQAARLAGQLESLQR